MIEPSHSGVEFFEAKYREQGDPWNFERSDYERSRYRAILAALGERRWGSALEPGCSIGVLTEALAAKCDRLHALDLSPTAVCNAQKRCGTFNHVVITCGALQDVASFADYDLIILSEIGYYFAEPVWKLLSARLIAEMKPGSTLLAAHWTGESDDHELSGDQVHEILLSSDRLKMEHGERHTGFRLNRWERV